MKLTEQTLLTSPPFLLCFLVFPDWRFERGWLHCCCGRHRLQVDECERCYAAAEGCERGGDWDPGRQHYGQQSSDGKPLPFPFPSARTNRHLFGSHDWQQIWFLCQLTKRRTWNVILPLWGSVQFHLLYLFIYWVFFHSYVLIKAVQESNPSTPNLLLSSQPRVPPSAETCLRPTPWFVWPIMMTTRSPAK